MEKIKRYPSIKERVENFKLFYKKENKRPLFGFQIGSEYPLYRYESAKKLPEDRALKPDDFIVEEYMEDCDRLFEEHEDCGGDFIWAGSIFWGIPWLEAILGCPIYANHATGSIYSKSPENGKTLKSLLFDEKSKWVIKAKEFLFELKKKSSGRWPIGTTRMRGIADLLSAVYGGDKFIYMMLEDEEEIHRVCERLTEIWVKFGKLQLDRIPLFYGGVGSFYYNMWAPKGTIWCQEDAAALLSPDLYKKFIEKCIRKIVRSFKSCIFHQHSTGYVPTESYLSMGMTALEMHIDTGGPTAEELYDVHNTILNKKPLLIWGKIPESDLDWIFSKLSFEGLAIIDCISSIKDAKRLWEEYCKYSYRWI
jgi:hypothetical protein